MSLLPLLLPVRETFPPIFQVQLALVALLLLTAEILALVPGPTTTLPATVCTYEPDVEAIPLNVAEVILKSPFTVRFPFAVPLDPCPRPYEDNFRSVGVRSDDSFPGPDPSAGPSIDQLRYLAELLMAATLTCSGLHL